MKPFTPEFITLDSGIPGKIINKRASIYGNNNEVFGVPLPEEFMDTFQVIRGKVNTVLRVNPPSQRVGYVSNEGKYELIRWDGDIFTWDEKHWWWSVCVWEDDLMDGTV